MKYHNRKKLNLLQQVFGRLTVIDTAPNIGNKTAWLCRCRCGNTVTVKTVNLRSGRTKDCGCIRKEKREALHYIDGTCIEMIRGDHLRKNNTSGCTGVTYDFTAKKWRAEIGFKGKRYTLGRYERFEDAKEAREKAKAEMHDSLVNAFDRSRSN